MKALLTAAMGIGLAMGLAAQAQAMPVSSLDTTEGSVIKVFGGCGPYGHRGPWGGCRPGGQAGGYRWGRSCPPGFHLGPYGARCWPNRYW